MIGLGDRAVTWRRAEDRAGDRCGQAKREQLREAGELLAVEAIDRTGLVITSEGAFVRIVRVVPGEPAVDVRRGAGEGGGQRCSG